jgi:glycosyltransferase involved in cell wall biosynthesis
MDREPLRIVHVNTENTWRGGEAQLLHLARGLARRGHRQWIVCRPGGPLLTRAAAAGLETHPLPMPSGWAIGSVFGLFRLLRAHSADVLHMHTSHAGTLGGIAGTLAGTRACILSRRVDFSVRGNPLRKLKYEWGIDRVVAVSEGIRRVLIDDGIRPGKISVVRSGIDLSAFDPNRSGNGFRKELGIDESVPLIGTVGHFADHKGHRYLVEAAPSVLKRIPGARFVLVGEGALRPTVEAQAAGLNLKDELIFTGFRDDIPSILAALDLFVLPSHLEGLCTSLMDAMAMGKPVVATRTGGVPEVVDDGITGRLVPTKDPGALADGIVEVMRDPQIRRRMGRAGLARVRERFSAEAMVEGTEKIYREILGMKAARTVRTPGGS